MGWYWDYKPARRPADGIKAQSTKFGQTWWASKWLAALERLIDAARLSRGRSYARSGQVLNIDIRPGRVDARVQGSRPAPYKVRIEIKPLSKKEWDRAADAMAAQAIFAAKLLAGEMPRDIEEAFAAARVGLFPEKSGDLATECSCPDWANPCKHIAAVYLLLGEQFDADPFLLFRLRGKNKEDIMAMLRARRSIPETSPEAAETLSEPEMAKPASQEERAPALEECLDRFWDIPASLDDLSATIQAPAVDSVPVKRLGVPGFWHNDKVDLLATFAECYAEVTRRSLETALGEETEILFFA